MRVLVHMPYEGHESLDSVRGEAYDVSVPVCVYVYGVICGGCCGVGGEGGCGGVRT